jgi:serine protease Do
MKVRKLSNRKEAKMFFTTQSRSSKSKKLKNIFAAGIPFLVVGLILASNANWTSPLTAGELTPAAQSSSLAKQVWVPSFAQLAESLSPSVVNVKVTKVEKAGFNRPQLPEGPFENFFERFFKEMPQMPHGRKSQGAGSGVIINSDGTILTNNHVVADAQEVIVTLSNNREYKAQVVGRDPKTDLAVLKIAADNALPAAVMGDSHELKVGDWVMAIGNPFGLSHTVTTGIVSAKGRVIGAGPYDDFIQTDASINPGNSGGPLFNMEGEVVGINTAIIPQGQGIGFAIPVNTAKPLIPQLVTKGEVTRGYLGVSIQKITPALAKALNVKAAHGALVADVIPNSPAEEGGLQRGDLIIAFNGSKVKDNHDLPAMVAAAPVENDAVLTVLRNGEQRELTVKIGKMASQNTGQAKMVGPAKGKWGLKLRNLNPEISQKLNLQSDQGVVVVGVEPDSPAQTAGLRQGDIILEINRTSVKSVDDVMAQIATADEQDSLLLLVQRRGSTFYLPLQQLG